MSKSITQDLIEEYKAVGQELDSISLSRRADNLSEDKLEAMDRREFELCVKELSLERKIRKSLIPLESDVRNRFFINRVIKDLEKRTM